VLVVALQADVTALVSTFAFDERGGQSNKNLTPQVGVPKATTNSPTTAGDEVKRKIR